MYVHARVYMHAHAHTHRLSLQMMTSYQRRSPAVCSASTQPGKPRPKLTLTWRSSLAPAGCMVRALDSSCLVYDVP